MTDKQREYLANGLKDLSNLIIAGLVIGQVLSNAKSLFLIVLGVVAYLFLNTIGVLLIKGEKK